MKYFFILIFMLIPCYSPAEIYKWVDDQGGIHYGDKPDTGDAVEVRVDSFDRSPEPGQVSREELRQRVSDSLEEDRLDKQKERENKKREREKKLKECNWLRDKQKRFESAGGLYRLDKDGNRVFMSDEARKKTEQSLQKKIKQTCR